MKRRTKIIGALVGLALLSGWECGGDPSVGGSKDFPPPVEAPKDGRPTCPEIEFRSPDERCFTLQTFLKSSTGPYDIYINITGGNGAYPPHVPIAAGGWKHGVVYRTGEKLVISMTVEVERPGIEDGFCSITDGSQHAKDAFKSAKSHGGAPYVAICTLTTSQ